MYLSSFPHFEIHVCITLQSLINVAPRLFIFEKKSTHYGLIEGATRIFNVSLSEAVAKEFKYFQYFLVGILSKWISRAKI